MGSMRVTFEGMLEEAQSLILSLHSATAQPTAFGPHEYNTGRFPDVNCCVDCGGRRDAAIHIIEPRPHVKPYHRCAVCGGNANADIRIMERQERVEFDDSLPSLDPNAKPHEYEQAEMTNCCKHCGGGKDHAVHSTSGLSPRAQRAVNEIFSDAIERSIDHMAQRESD